MDDLLSFLANPVERANLLRNALDATTRGVVAGTLGAPADLANLAINAGRAGIGYIGHKTGVLSADQMPEIIDNPIGGSEWIGQKMQNAGLLSGYRNPTAEAISGGLLGPMTTAAVANRAPQIARGLLQMQENAAAPSTMANQGQRGMIRIPGRGQIPETRADVNKLADRFGKLLDDAGVNYEADKSGLSPARYFNFEDAAQEPVKVRISDHQNIHGATHSVDPTTGATFEEMLQALRNEHGIPVANKAKPVSKAVIDDATLEKVYGVPVSVLADRGILESARSRYQWKAKPDHPSGGFWIQKPD